MNSIKIRGSFFILNAVLVVGLLFPGQSVGIYFCTIAPAIFLLIRDSGNIPYNISLFIILVFISNVIIQSLIGYFPNAKLMLNFVGHLLMVYSIGALLKHESDFRSYLHQNANFAIYFSVIFIFLCVGVQAFDFFYLNPNYHYVAVNKMIPVISIEKQVIAPFLFVGALALLARRNINSLVLRGFLYAAVLTILFVALASRSVLFGAVVTLLVFLFRRMLANIVLSSVAVSMCLAFVFSSVYILEDYIGIFRTLDIRGVVYFTIFEEILDNPFGIGYGNTVPYLALNNSSLFSDSFYSLNELANTNQNFSSVDFDSFPLNIESSLLIAFLEQGIVVGGLLYIFMVNLVAQLFYRHEGVVRVYIFSFSTFFFSALTEDSFLLIPFLFCFALLLRLRESIRRL